MSRRGRTVLVFLAGVTVGAAVLLWLRRGEDRAANRAAPASAAPATGGGSRAGAPSAPAPPAGVTADRRRAAADRLRRDIEAARRRREAAAPAPAPAPGGGAGQAAQDPPAALDKNYIRDRIAEVKPLIAECYEQALERDPRLAGVLVVRFVIAGEPDVGGVVESSEVDVEKSTLADPELSLCVQESMYAAEFAAPPEGGKVTVSYPFKFAASPE